MLKRLWTVISLSWVAFCLWGFNDSGELRHMTVETYAMLFAPFIIRIVVLFILFGIPRTVPGGFTAQRRSPR